MAVLQDPPKRVPRSPTLVRATLAEVSYPDSEDAGPPVEVRWRVPSQASLAPASCGDVERYYVKCWWRGKGKEVMRTKTSTVDVPRRDFCRNQVHANETSVFCCCCRRCPAETMFFGRKLTRGVVAALIVNLALRHYYFIVLHRRGFFRSEQRFYKFSWCLALINVQPETKTLRDPVRLLL